MEPTTFSAEPRPARARLAGTAVLVALVPLLASSRTVFYRYGFRDDYPLLREAREEPGKILRVCSAQGRILYGWLLELAMRSAGGGDGLRWIRLGGALGLSVLAAGVFLITQRSGWRRPHAASLAALVVLPPSAQVFISWATASPLVAALLLGAASSASRDTGSLALIGSASRATP